jgi:hypothetical protein
MRLTDFKGKDQRIHLSRDARARINATQEAMDRNDRFEAVVALELSMFPAREAIPAISRLGLIELIAEGLKMPLSRLFSWL